MKAAVAIGGASALAAVRSRAAGSIPQGDPSVLPDRQYAWDDFVPRNEVTGKAKTPLHHVMLHLNYAGEGTPTDADRQQVEAALQTLERAFEWSNEGLLFTLSYSGSYFDRFDEDLPEGTGLVDPETVIDEVDITKDKGRAEADNNDAHFHMASDNPQATLAAEQALRGELDTVNGVDVEGSFDGVFEFVERRTGFIGAPRPHENWDADVPGKNPIAEDSPVFFGFKSLFSDSQPTEDDVVIEDGHPFAGGTTEEVSLLEDTKVREWYRQHDHEERVQRMFSPHHTSEEAGQHGRQLAPTSGTEELTMDEISELTAQDADEKTVVGHAQKLARARDPGPPILRRDFPSTDSNKPHTQFISLQRSIEDFISVRKAMSFVDLDDPGSAESELDLKDHGILGFLRTLNRGTFLVPPRDLRALPPANP